MITGEDPSVGFSDDFDCGGHWEGYPGQRGTHVQIGMILDVVEGCEIRPHL